MANHEASSPAVFQEEKQLLGPAQEPVLYLAVNETVIYEKIKNQDTAEHYAKLAQVLIKYLPAEEQNAFANDPIGFTSNTQVFRGLTKEKFADLVRHGEYRVQAGAVGGEGVYFSNSPYAAFTHQQNGVIAAVDKKNLHTVSAHGIVEIGSALYSTANAAYLASLPEGEKPIAVYTMDNRWDLSEPSSADKPAERNVVMRKNQPVEITKVFLEWDGRNIIETKPAT